MADLRIGCSGWAYKDWRGPFYPPDVKVKDHLADYASRFLTHNKTLNDPKDSPQLILERMAALGDRFGPILFQPPPSLGVNLERLAAFLALLPGDRRATVQFRRPGWYARATFDLLARHDAPLCLSDHHHAPAPWETTASFVYVRRHGPGGRYYGRYPDQDLEALAGRIAAWREQGKDVYCYFDNDIKSAAPQDADRLLQLTAQA